MGNNTALYVGIGIIVVVIIAVAGYFGYYYWYLPSSTSSPAAANPTPAAVATSATPAASIAAVAADKTVPTPATAVPTAAGVVVEVPTSTTPIPSNVNTGTSSGATVPPTVPAQSTTAIPTIVPSGAVIRSYATVAGVYNPYGGWGLRLMPSATNMPANFGDDGCPFRAPTAAVDIPGTIRVVVITPTGDPGRIQLQFPAKGAAYTPPTGWQLDSEFQAWPSTQPGLIAINVYNVMWSYANQARNSLRPASGACADLGSLVKCGSPNQLWVLPA